jgi:hypothetical protein
MPNRDVCVIGLSKDHMSIAFERATQGLQGAWRVAAAEIKRLCDAKGISFDLRTVVLCLRDMTYQRPTGGQSGAAALQEWRGTCSTKHLALHDLLSQLGHSPKLKMASFLVDSSFPIQNEELRSRLGVAGVHDVHNFISCDLGRGEVIMDVTFPLAMESLGFTVTRDWDGESDFRLACTPAEVREVDIRNATQAKQEWLDELNTGGARELRESVILEISRIMTTLKSPLSRSDAIIATLGNVAKQA